MTHMKSRSAQFKKSKLLNLLNEFSFNKQNIERLFDNYQNITSESKQIRKKSPSHDKATTKKNVKYDDDFIIPNEKDTVFWCWLIFTQGLSNYTILRDRAFVTEKQEKIQFIEKLRKNKKMLKKYKIKLCDMEANLTMSNLLDIIYLEPMIMMENYNFIYLDDKIYYENINDEDNKTCVIKYFKDTEKYGIYLNKCDKLKTGHLYKIDNLSKPIKAISNYKADEIREICTKLKINVMKTPTKFKTKTDLYNLIKERLS